MKKLNQIKSFCIALLMFSSLSKTSAQQTGNFETSIILNNIKHTVAYSVPTDYNDSNKYPLIVGLHECNGNAITYRNVLKDFSTKKNAIVICPDDFGSNMLDRGLIKNAIDSAISLYNIDTTMVFLTGFSCNAAEVLKYGLDHLYKFKGLFPWAPYNANLIFNQIDTTMPVVLAVGNADANFATDMLLYDSLKAYHSNIQLIVVPGVGHNLPSIGTMFKCYQYLTDSNKISFSSIKDTIIDSKTPEIKFVLRNMKHSFDSTLVITAYNNVNNIVGTPTIIYNKGEDSAILSIIPNSNLKYNAKVKVIVEVAEKYGTAIEQTVFNIYVKVKPKLNISASSQNSIYDGPENAIDGKTTTKWISQKADSQWICIDLGKVRPINGATLSWSHYAKEYYIETSNDSINWNSTYQNLNGKLGKITFSFDPIQARYIKLLCTKTNFADYSLYEFQVDTSNLTSIQKVSKNDFSIYPTMLMPNSNILHISYNLSIPSKVEMSIFNMQGQKLKTLVNHYQEAGNYNMQFDNTNNCLPGIYFINFTTPFYREQKKFVITK